MSKRNMKFPECRAHMDCFANKGGRCVSLSRNDFEDRDCPFYKHGEPGDWERVEAACTAYGLTHGIERKGN